MERLQHLALSILTVSIAAVFLAGVLTTVDAQPQPPVADLASDPEWLILEFDNGSTWYMRSSSVQAMWAIPAKEAKKLGYKTRIYGTSYSINAPYTLKEIETRMITGKAQHLLNRIKQETEE